MQLDQQVYDVRESIESVIQGGLQEPVGKSSELGEQPIHIVPRELVYDVAGRGGREADLGETHAEKLVGRLREIFVILDERRARDDGPAV